MNFYDKIIKIQSELKVPKQQRNKFGNYNYRSCEDIVEGVKPLSKELGLALLISDELVLIGERYYIKATAKLTDGENEEFCNGYARESANKKGMDDSQLTGSTSSYARKYALNGLLAIDDTKDADNLNKHGKGKTSTKTPVKKKVVKQTKKPLDPAKVKALYTLATKKGLADVDVKKGIKTHYNAISTKDLTLSQFNDMMKRLNKLEDKKAEVK